MLVDPLDRLAFGVVAVTARAVHEVAGAELTFLGWRVLVVLGDEEGEIRLGSLAARLALSAPSASKLVRRLERRGLVTLARDRDDRRGLLVQLATDGARIRAAVIERRREAFRAVTTDPLPAGLADGLATLADRIAAFDAGAPAAVGVGR